jgi:quercetin dioxygenase-like cupin family protein
VPSCSLPRGVITPTWIGSFRAGAGDRPHPGIERQSFDTDAATIVSYRFEAGASFPLHRHPEEQITIVEEGQVDFLLGSETRQLSAGDWVVTAPETPHGIVAAEDARFLAIIIPRRRSGDGYVVVEPPR